MASSSSKESRCSRCHRSANTSLLAVAILLASPLTLLSQAQTSSAPLTVFAPAFARTATRLYVLGGRNAATIYSQFFSLDLTNSWNSATPLWTKLKDGPGQAIFPAAFSADQKTMVTFHSNSSANASFAYHYSVVTGQWTQSTVQAQFGSNEGVGAVTDPNTGLVYLAGGYASEDRNSINVYNFETDTMSANALPPSTTVFPNREYYANVWSQKRKSILYFGGYSFSSPSWDMIPSDNTVAEFVPSASTWSTLVTSGTAPAMRVDHCMASNDDGSLMVIYGGRLSDRTTLSGEIFIFDTVGRTWRQGLTGPLRVYTACTIAGNQLLVWGGQSSTDLVVPTAVLIYDLDSNAWITQYTPPASYVAARASETISSSPKATSTGSPSSSPDATSTGSPSSDGSSPSNVGAIVGGIVACVAVLCAGAFFFIFRRRRRQQHKAIPLNTASDHKGSEESGRTTPPRTHDDELQQMRTQIQNQQEQIKLLSLQQQQQQLQLPIQPQHQYQDATYNYQPPIFYSAAGGQTANPLIATTAGSSPQEWDTAHTSPGSMKLVPTSGGLARAGYVDGGNSYANAQQQHLGVMPVVYNPPPTTAGSSEAATEVKGEYESNYREKRPLGSPHAIIET